jgi:hypothetical protein
MDHEETKTPANGMIFAFHEEMYAISSAYGVSCRARIGIILSFLGTTAPRERSNQRRSSVRSLEVGPPFLRPTVRSGEGFSDVSITSSVVQFSKEVKSRHRIAANPGWGGHCPFGASPMHGCFTSSTRLVGHNQMGMRQLFGFGSPSHEAIEPTLDRGSLLGRGR